MIVGSSVLALENSAQLCYQVAVHTSYQQWGRLIVPHPPSVDDVMYMQCSGPNKCGVIPHYFNSMSPSSVQFSCSVVSDSLWPHELQHARLPCLSPTPRACSNSCPSSQWCHPTVSSSVVPFSSLLKSFPASGSFPVSEFFTLGGQNIGASASASVLPMNIQGWFPLGLTDLISLMSKGLSRVFSRNSKA